MPQHATAWAMSPCNDAHICKSTSSTVIKPPTLQSCTRHTPASFDAGSAHPSPNGAEFESRGQRPCVWWSGLRAWCASPNGAEFESTGQRPCVWWSGLRVWCVAPTGRNLKAQGNALAYGGCDYVCGVQAPTGRNLKAQGNALAYGGRDYVCG